MLAQASASTRAVVGRSLKARNIQPVEGGTVYAYANHGRWVASCPCNGAELVQEGHNMVCGSCGLTHTVVFPLDMGEIEDALRRRQKMNQNWVPGETVDLLAADNLKHGVI